MRKLMLSTALALGLAACATGTGQQPDPTTIVTGLQASLLVVQGTVLVWETQKHPDPATLAKVLGYETAATDAIGAAVKAVQAGQPPSAAVLAAAQAALTDLQNAFAQAQSAHAALDRAPALSATLEAMH